MTNSIYEAIQEYKDKLFQEYKTYGGNMFQLLRKKGYDLASLYESDSFIEPKNENQIAGILNECMKICDIMEICSSFIEDGLKKTISHDKNLQVTSIKNDIDSLRKTINEQRVKQTLLALEKIEKDTKE